MEQLFRNFAAASRAGRHRRRGVVWCGVLGAPSRVICGRGDGGQGGAEERERGRTDGRTDGAADRRTEGVDGLTQFCLDSPPWPPPGWPLKRILQQKSIASLVRGMEHRRPKLHDAFISLIAHPLLLRAPDNISG